MTVILEVLFFFKINYEVMIMTHTSVNMFLADLLEILLQIPMLEAIC